MRHSAIHALTSNLLETIRNTFFVCFVIFDYLLIYCVKCMLWNGEKFSISCNAAMRFSFRIDLVICTLARQWWHSKYSINGVKISNIRIVNRILGNSTIFCLFFYIFWWIYFSFVNKIAQMYASLLPIINHHTAINCQYRSVYIYKMFIFDVVRDRGEWKKNCSVISNQNKFALLSAHFMQRNPVTTVRNKKKSIQNILFWTITRFIFKSNLNIH